MKRVLVMALSAILCLSLAGCGMLGSLAGLLKNGDRDYIVDDSLRPPEEDDFNVYEGGRLVFSTEDMIVGFNFKAPYAENLKEEYTGEPYDFRGREIETKRGIHIGSTMEEVVEAYGGTAFALPCKGPDDYYTVFDISVEEVARELKKGKKGEEQSFYTERYVTKEGEALTIAGTHDFVYDNHYSGLEVFTHLDEYYDSAWSLWFHVTDGVITGIGVSNDLAD